MSHMLVVLFAACGVFGMVAYLEDIDTTAGYPVFLKGLAEVSWPLVVAAALYMLIQIACQVQQVALTLRMQGMVAAGRGGFEVDGALPQKEESAPSVSAPPPSRRVSDRKEPVEKQHQPASFFDISDAVIPPVPRPVPAADGEKTQVPPAASQPPAGVEKTPTFQASDSSPQEKEKADKSAHFFTLD